jgi:hypothetical protein
MSELKLNAERGAKICLRSFDDDSELEIEVNNESIWLNANQVMEIMVFLSNEVNKLLYYNSEPIKTSNKQIE